jgi:hypothetical protein
MWLLLLGACNSGAVARSSAPRAETGADGHTSSPDAEGEHRVDAPSTSAPADAIVRDGGDTTFLVGPDSGGEMDVRSGTGALGGPSRCTNARLPICLDFEGAFPPGWAPAGAIEATRAARGSRALHIKAAAGGQAFIRNGTLNLGASIWGRYFLYFEQRPTTHRWLVNAQSDNGQYFVGVEFEHFIGNYLGNGVELTASCTLKLSCPTQDVSDALVPIERWVCLEFQMDVGNGVPTAVFVDGQKLNLRDTAGRSSWPKGSRIAALSVGMIFPRSETADLWVDELAVDTKRIGCAQ